MLMADLLDRIAGPYCWTVLLDTVSSGHLIATVPFK